MKCNVENPANGKKSELHDQFLSIFQDAQLAEIAYAKVLGNSFMQRFGNWDKVYRNEKGFENEKIGLVNPKTGEPLLKKDLTTGMWFFTDKNGDRDYIDKYKFSEFTAQQVEEVTEHLLYNFVLQSGKKSYNNYDPSQLEKGRIMDSIEKTIASYKEKIKGRENETELLERIELVEKNKEDFRTELISTIDRLGVKIREKITDEKGNPITEVAEEDRGGGVNIQESFETNSKETATVNTKIFLSQIEERVFAENEDGIEVSVPVEDGFLEMPMFAKFDDVWNTLNSILVDEIGYGHGENVVDIFDVMYNKINDFRDTKPWMHDLLDKLDFYVKTNNKNKITEFVQAFNKTHLNYFVTQVDNGKYTVINATSTNSRRSQLMNKWNNGFIARFLDQNGKLQDRERGVLAQIFKDAREAERLWNEDLQNAGTNRESEAYQSALLEAASLSAVDLVDILQRLGATDIFTDDINTLVTMNGGDKKMEQTIDLLHKQISFLLNDILQPDFQFSTKDAGFENIFNRENSTRAFAEAVGMRMTDMADMSVLLNDGKTGYTVSNPTYISNKINEWKKDPSALEKMAMDKSKQNSVWLRYLLALDTPKGAERTRLRDERLDGLKAGLDSSFKSKRKNDGVDNTSITTNDQINANIVQMLNGLINKSSKSMFPTIIAADKSRRILFEGFNPIAFNIQLNSNDGSIYISPKAVEVALGYFLDEYNRMKRVNRENSDDTIKKVVYYHGKDGNGLKSQIFPEFNKDSTDPKYKELRDAIYGKTFEDSTYDGLSKEQENIVRKFIENDIRDRVSEHAEKLSKIDGISKDIVDLYKNKGGEVGMAGDYFMNGLIASVEYTKLFSGDPAYYKNNADLIKRIPATYTDGLQLRLEDGDSIIFNQATISGVEVASKYVQKIKDSLKDKSIADAYDRVNTTDAQAWITPRRWRFLKQKLGQWGPQHDKVYKKMMSGETMRPAEMKLVAQPLKGVYFEINEGRPVYLKYSQAVLIPSLVKGTPMEALYNKMTKDPATGKPYGEKEGHKEIHEVITIDGVKVGAVEPTTINKAGTTELLSEEDIVLNPQVLSNRGWKLQQDLPIKNMKETNVGSQIQKNIFEGLDLTGEYNVDGVTNKGFELAERIHNTVSKLSNLGKDEIKKSFGIDENNVISDKQYIYNALIEEFTDRGGNENVIDALRKQMPFDAIPQIKGKVESIFMSIMNRKMTKISTQGGSFIQVSPFGIEKVGKKEVQVSPKIETVDRYSVEDVKNNRNKIYVFGDNTERSGTGGQAQIRNNSNAMGIATKISPNNKPEAFMSDKNLEENKKVISSDIQKILDTKKELVFPKDGFGTGLAKLKESAPKTYAYLKAELMDKFGFDNDTGVVTPVIKTEEVDSGITIVSKDYNGEGLLPPRIENGKVLPGQAFISHTQAMKLLAKHKISLEGKDLASAMALLDPSALELITYRIPNQGMSSNDYLQIVGVLPAGVGDSIVVYDGLPAKTGSDFDIDKLFAMQNNLVFDPEIMRLTKLTAENKHLAVDDNGNQVSEAKIEKMLAQNELVSLYKSVLNSPLTYDSMMRSIDGAQLKDDIVGNKKKGIKGLFEAPVMKNMELFSPLTQLETKSEYLSGKMGVGQTANHLVDHVMNQSLNVRFDSWIGIGNQKEVEITSGKRKGEKKLVTFFDSETTGSNSIADNLSAFLNAYVDIAKDPYVARANHNSITANTTFMLLRAGVDMKWVNRFIGQPILKELIQLQQEQMSITAEGVEVSGEKASPLEKILDKYGFRPIGNNITGKTVSDLTESELEANIRADKTDPDLDYEVLKAWIFLKDKAKLFSEGVIAAKSDTVGTGGSNIERQINENKITKILTEKDKSKKLVGYEAKFKGTMLGTYRDNTLNWVRDVVRASNLFLSGTQGAIDTFNNISNETANGKLLTDEELGRAVNGAFYSYIMSGTTLFKDNNKRYDVLTTNVPLEIQKRQLAISDGTAERNFLIEEFEFGTYKNKQYVGINNKNKPTYYENQIYRGWMDLYESYNYKEDGSLDMENIHPDKKFAIDLARYAFLSSGFQNNLSQFFTHIPHQILKDFNMSGEVRDAIAKADEMTTDEYFVDQFQRHSSDNGKVVKTLKIQKMQGDQYAFIYKPAKNKSQEFGSEDGTFPKFVNGRWGRETFLFERVGTVSREDANGQKMRVPVYARTFKLGTSEGKYKTFEYEKGVNITESKVKSNNVPILDKLKVQEKVESIMRMEETFKDNNAKKFDPVAYNLSKEAQLSDYNVIKQNLSQIIEDKKISCK